MLLSKYAKIEKLLERTREPPYRFYQIMDAVFRKKVSKFNKISNLPIKLRTELHKELGGILTLKPVKIQKERQAEKVLFELRDGNCIETVRMRFRNDYGKEWNSLCISCQVGCPVGCSFCATGKMGFKRNLTTDEITDQVLYFHLKGVGTNNISFMGMGEPFLNPNTLKAVGDITNKKLFSYSQRRISLSTVGFASELEKYIEIYPFVNISYSLHTPFEDQRRSLIPLENISNIKEVFRILNKYVEKNKRKIFVGYIMISRLNDTSEHLEKLIELIKSQKNSYLYHVNLIKFNKVSGIHFRSSTRSRIGFFIRSLRKEKINVTLRQSFGSKISAACGQLFTK